MDKSFWIFRNPKQAIFCIMILLMIIGCINVFSASYIMAKDSGNPYSYLIRYIIFGLFGYLAMKLTRKIGYKRFLQPNLLFGIYITVAISLMLVLLFPAVKGAHRWIFLPGMSIQPSEIAKLVVIMLCASSLGSMLKKKDQVRLYKGRSGKILALTFIYCFLVYIEPDLGTAAIIMGLMLGMFIIAGMPGREIWLVTIVGLIGGALLTMGTAYRRERVMVMLDPWRDPLDKGYQMVQSQTAIGSGGLFGTHWGQGVGKFFYLPEAHTDFAFAIFSQENGFVGVVVLMALFLMLGYIFMHITLRVKDEQGFLLAGGVTFLIVGQSIANMAMVGGLLPVIGVPLVFISYGGSSMVISMVAIGLLLSVYDEAVKQEKREKLAKEAPENRRETLQFTSTRRWH